MIQTTLRFETEFHKKLKILAIEEGLSMTALVEKLVEKHMEKRGGRK